MEQHFTAKTDVGARTILQGRKIVRPGKTFGAQTWARFVKLARKLRLTLEECTVSRYEASRKNEREVKRRGEKQGPAPQGRRRVIRRVVRRKRIRVLEALTRSRATDPDLDWDPDRRGLFGVTYVHPAET